MSCLAEDELPIRYVNGDNTGAIDGSREDTLGEFIQYRVLDDTADRTGAELGIVACFAYPLDSPRRVAQFDAIRGKESSSSIELHAYDLVNLFSPQGCEDDGLIDTIEELWSDRPLQEV